MSALRRDQFLASAALVFILAAPVSALGQQTEPSQAGLRAPSKAGDASAGDALTSPPASATQAAAPAIAPEESRAPDRLTALDPADRAIAERIRDLLDTKPNRIFADEKAHAAVEAFYQKRNLAPLWLDKGLENARSKAVIARLKNADADGLDHADYKTPTFGGLSPDALAEAELSLTQTVLTYARHLQAGRVPHRQVREDNIALPQRAPDPAVVLAAVVEGDDAGQALDQFSPPYENYRKLKAALSQLRGRTAGGARDGITAGRMLTFNRKRPMEDARVPQLRERLGVPGEATDLRYDEKLAQAVKEYQRGNDLPPTGNLDARTVKKLNPTNDSRIDTIIANMERWRWYHARHPQIACGGQRARLHPQGDPRRTAGVDLARCDRQAEHAEPAAGATDGFHHHQPDLEGAGVDRSERVPAGGGERARRAGAHGDAHETRQRRGGDHDAAGRQESARAHSVQFLQSSDGVSARHPGPIPVRPRCAGRESRLHARAGCSQIRRSPCRHGAP